MSTVMAMKLNDHQALVIADESSWHLSHVFGYRRANVGDSVGVLVPPEVTAAHGLAAVYGGVGFPSFHDEVARRARAHLEAADEQAAGNAGAERAVAGAFARTHARMIDDKLRFDYGFTLDELNARAYTRDGVRHAIAQEAVVGAARALAAGGVPTNAATRLFSNRGLLVSRDPDKGVQCWYLEPHGCHLAWATPLAVVGDGDGLASHLMAQYQERRDIARRRKGFPVRQGLFVAMRIAAELHARVGSMGGYLQLVLVDGARGTRELMADASHLALEVARAQIWGFLDREVAEELVARLVLEGADDADVEEEMFARAGDGAATLERYLMGFKPAEAPASFELDPPPRPPPRTRPTKGKAPPPRKRARENGKGARR